MTIRYNENDTNIANGILKLDENGLVPSDRLPAGLSGFYMDKQLYYVGELFTLTSSQYWKPLEDIYIINVEFELGAAPTGTGQTVVKLIRNNDANDVLYVATFVSGDLTYLYTTNQLISAGDKVSLSISETTTGFHGSDLNVSIQYSKTQD